MAQAAVPQNEISSKQASPRGVLAGLLVSLAILAPCWWHAHIEAGDVASHTYNAWLANHVDTLHGLSLVWQWTNVVYDVVLAHLCRWFGYSVGEKLAVSMVALALFWGMWSLVRAAAQPASKVWIAAPVVAMLTYSWTFHMGLMNFCLSAGLSCLALALWIRRRPRANPLVIPLLLLACLAHVLPVLVVLACGAYALLRNRLQTRHQLLLLLGAVAVMMLASHVLLTRFLAALAPFRWTTILGVNQFILYTESPYRWIGYAITLLLWGPVFLFYRRRWRELLLSTPLQLALLFMVGIMILPTTMSGVGSGVSLVVERLSLGVPLCACLLLARARPPRCLGIVLAVLALAYFAVLWGQSRVLNGIEEATTAAARMAPAGSRVVLLMPYGDNTSTIAHMIDRACIGYCFSYANYEASTRQFRVRAQPGNGMIVVNYFASFELQLGRYTVQRRDAPLYEVYVCDRAADRFCLRELRAGDPLAP